MSLYDSEIYDLIDRTPASIGGQTVIGGAQVLARTNFGRTRMLGYETSGNVRATDSISIWGNASHSSGRNITNGDYLGFEGGIPPTQGWLGLRWEPVAGRAWFEVYGQIVDKQDRITGIPLALGGRFSGPASADAVDARIGAYRTRAQIASYRQFHGIPLDGDRLPDSRRIAPIGEIADTLMYRNTPGFATLNFRGGLKLSENHSVNLLLENALDKNYLTAQMHWF